MQRYSVLPNREIVLLKSKPCFWGKCTFCDYIEDNSINLDQINAINKDVLKNITGSKKSLEVINSGSCFELPETTLQYIKNIVVEKNIKTLYLESHWIYKDKLNEMRDFFNIPIIFKIGVETFDNEFRNTVLNKNAHFSDVTEVKMHFDSVCLMVGIVGQTKEMIKKDINLLISNFDYGTINIFCENNTSIKKDPSIIEWFKQEYKYLESMPNIDVLYENTDFGVGD